MPHPVCPWWVGYFLASPLRRWLHNPTEILSPYVREGMTVLEPGPGMGFFTLPMARLVGASGRVIAVDVQPRMIASLKRRAAKANLLDRIDARVTSADTLAIADLASKVDFTLAFAMVHELPDADRFFREVAAVSKTGAKLLLAEPRGHVSEAKFAAELSAAATVQLVFNSPLTIRSSRAALLVKTGS
jgi:SAM-dependent methyltransferase